jgi:hypothetical protein
MRSMCVIQRGFANELTYQHAAKKRQESCTVIKRSACCMFADALRSALSELLGMLCMCT